MRFGSLFTGIGGLDLGLELAGHEVAFQAEIDPYRRAVLARRWFPGAPRRYERVEDVGAEAKHLEVELLAGGFPCQDLSIAGLRGGLAGPRSGLFYEFARVADTLLGDGGWILLENVSGLLGSNDGRDFAVLLATLAELRFLDCAWRVLDSRHFGVAHRRRRIFILARRSRGRRSAEVLLEPESGGGDFEASRAAREAAPREIEDGVSGPLGSTTAASEHRGGMRFDLDGSGAFIPELAGPITRRIGKGINTTIDDGAAIVSDRMRAPSGAPGRLDGPDDPVSAFSIVPESGQGADLRAAEVDTSPALTAIQNAEQTERGVRIVGSQNGSDAAELDPPPDGPRYAAIGDAVTVPVAEWIGRRLYDLGG